MLKTFEFLLAAIGIIGLSVYGWTVMAREADADRLVADYTAASDVSSAVAGDGEVREAGSTETLRSYKVTGEADELIPDRSYWSQSRREDYAAARSHDLPVIGVLSIPAIELKAPVLKGISDAALDSGIGWLDRTSVPGNEGNAAFAGHRDSFFRQLGELEPGAVLNVDMKDERFSYRVTGHSIVTPDDVSVLRKLAGKTALTLITCYPFYFVGPAPKRYIVHAELVEATSQPSL